MTELEELKKENEILKSRLETIANIDKESKYKQALEEIKELAGAIINGKHITNDIEGHLKELSKQIIDKISEVENG